MHKSSSLEDLRDKKSGTLKGKNSEDLKSRYICLPYSAIFFA